MWYNPYRQKGCGANRTLCRYGKPQRKERNVFPMLGHILGRIGHAVFSHEIWSVTRILVEFWDGIIIGGGGAALKMKEFARGFYCSPEWVNCRRAFISSKKGLCELCLKRGIYNAGVIVHHKVHLTPQNITDPNIALCFDNLQLLCRACHAEVHAGKRYRFDQDGRCITAHA